MQQKGNNEMVLVDYVQLQEKERQRREKVQNDSQISQVSGSFVYQIGSPKSQNIQVIVPQNKKQNNRDQQNEAVQRNIKTQLTPLTYQVELVSQHSEYQQQSSPTKGNKIEILDKNQMLKITQKNNRVKSSYQNDKVVEDQRQDRMRRRKQKREFNNILNGSEGTRQHTKTVEQDQGNNQGRNIQYGKIQQHSNQHTQNQKTENALREEDLTIKQYPKDPKPAKQLPPLKRQRPKKQELQPTSLYQNDNSLMALQKYIERMNQNIGSVNQQQGVFNHFAFKPIPEQTNIKFLFKRQKKIMQNYYHPQYSLIFNLNKLVFNARKDWGHINSHYNISCEEKYYAKSGKYYAGYLKGNFGGTKFNLFSCHDGASELLATIVYKAELNCIQQTYRQFQVYVKKQDYAYSQLTGHVQGQFIDLKELYQISDNASGRKIIKLVNKKAEWCQRLGAFVMNFKGKLKMASVKNTILVEEGKEHQDILILCKEQQNQFYLQVGHPLDPFMAMGIVLSSFDFKLLCQ